MVFFTMNIDRLQVFLRTPIEPNCNHMSINLERTGGKNKYFPKCSSAKCISTIDGFPCALLPGEKKLNTYVLTTRRSFPGPAS